MYGSPVSNKVGPDAAFPVEKAKLNLELNSVPLGAPEFGKVAEDVLFHGTFVVNCANTEGVRPNITQGLQLVTVWVPCGPLTVESCCPFAATTYPAVVPGRDA